MILYFELFVFGIILSDIEHLTKGFGRPLDALRNLSIWWKIPLNLVLIVIFLIYGSLNEYADDFPKEDMGFYRAVRGYEYLSWLPWEDVGALAIMILCLTSEWAQWILSSYPFRFLGKISYTLYLSHYLVMQVAMF